MRRPKDGDVVRVNAEILMQWVEGDRSVGIDDGMLPIAIFIGGRDYVVDYEPGCKLVLTVAAMEQLQGRAYDQLTEEGE